MIPSGRHSYGYDPIPGGRYTPGAWSLTVRYIPRTDRAAAVTIEAPSGLPLARLDIETVSDLEAIQNGRLVAAAPRMAAALHDLDAFLDREGKATDHPARVLIRDTLDRVLRVPLAFL